MRGGKSLTDRGIIPRLLSSIYRRSRKIEKDSEGASSVEVSMSYYEIYNDRVYDLFEAPEKRTAAGLSLREAGNGKTVVVGLTEVPCGTLKEFEGLYDSANANRSTSATKLNAHSSRSHAILCVKVTVTGPNEIRISTASAIDLAGSEDNRRTGNDKERMVESASINKSLFVLAQCVEAISKKQQRIPYRESKMTRILSLGQNNGFTVMILNLAPVKSFHLDTLSSLNFANRTKKIEVREVENEPIFKGPPRAVPGVPTVMGSTIQRQPLRPLTAAINANIGAQQANPKGSDKPLKAFSVYSDKNKPRSSNPTAQTRPAGPAHKSSPAKRGADSSMLPSSRPTKQMRPTSNFIRRAPDTHLTKATIESLVEQKVSEILAGRAPLQVSEAGPQQQSASAAKGISEEVQRRLESIEQRLEGQEGARAEGLSYLLMAKQHQTRGEDGSALRMYRLARPYFPENEKLVKKIAAIEDRIHAKREEEVPHDQSRRGDMSFENADTEDESYHDEHDAQGGSEDAFEGSDSDASFHFENRSKKAPARRVGVKKIRVSSPDPLGGEQNGGSLTPRTAELLRIINSRDVSKIKLLKGVGVKRAEGIVECLQDMDDQNEVSRMAELRSLKQLGRLRGVGTKILETMRLGLGSGLET
jgi:Kinesin motor domain